MYFIGTSDYSKPELIEKNDDNYVYMTLKGGNKIIIECCDDKKDRRKSLLYLARARRDGKKYKKLKSLCLSNGIIYDDNLKVIIDCFKKYKKRKRISPRREYMKEYFRNNDLQRKKDNVRCLNRYYKSKSIVLLEKHVKREEKLGLILVN